MDIRKLIILFAAAIILIAGIVLFLASSKKSPAPAELEKTGREEILEEIEKLRKDSHVGIPMVYEEGCDKIRDVEEKDICSDNENMAKARIDGDLGKCDKIKKGMYKNYCYSRVAWDENKTVICDLIKNEDSRNGCISDIAVKNLDMSICNNIYELHDRKECQAVTAAFTIEQKDQDVKKCFEIPKIAEYRNHCILDLTFRVGPSICDSLKKERKDICLSWYIITLAIAQKSEGMCMESPLENFRRVCVNMIRHKGSQFEVDTDSDGIDDLNELRMNSNPFDSDTDKDSLSDYDELFKYKTNPEVFDTDGDGYSDGEEVKKGYDPLKNEKQD